MFGPRPAQKSLSLALILALSGLPQTLALAKEGETNPAREFTLVRKHALRVQEVVRKLTRRQKFVGTPGTGTTRPSLQEISNADQSVGDLKRRVESFLAEPTVSDDLRADALNLYFGTLTSMMLLRLAVKWSASPATQEHFGLVVPEDFVQKNGGLIKSESNRFGHQYHVMESKKLPSQPEGTLTVLLSPSFIHGLEIGSLAETPNSENFLTLVQYISVQHFIQNISTIRHLRGAQDERPIAIPSPLFRKLEAMQVNLQELHKKDRVATEEPRLRELLVTHAPQKLQNYAQLDWIKRLVAAIQNSKGLEDQIRSLSADLLADRWMAELAFRAPMPTFSANNRPEELEEYRSIVRKMIQAAPSVPTTLIDSLMKFYPDSAASERSTGGARLLPFQTETPSKPSEIARSVVQDLVASIPADFSSEDLGSLLAMILIEDLNPDTLSEYLSARAEVLHPMDSLAMASVLKQVVASTFEAQCMTTWMELLELYTETHGGRSLFTLNVRKDLIRLIEERTRSYAEELEDSEIHAWIKRARAEMGVPGKSEYSERLLQIATGQIRELDPVLSGERVDLSSLAQALISEIPENEFSESLSNLLYEVLSAGEYIDARDRYGEILSRELGPEIISKSGYVSPTAARKALEDTRFGNKIVFKIPDGMSREMADQLRKEVVAGLRNSLKSLLQIGERLGFHHRFIAGQSIDGKPIFRELPTLEHLLPEWDAQNRDLRNRYFHALKERLQDQFPMLSMKLDGDQTLLGLLQSNSSNQVRISEILDAALLKAEEMNEKNIHRVATATSVEEVALLIESEGMMQILSGAFPEFGAENSDTLDQLQSSSLYDQAMNRWVHPAGLALLPIMLGHGSKLVGIAKNPRSIFFKIPIIGKKASKRGLFRGVDLVMKMPFVRGLERALIVALFAGTVHFGVELKRKTDHADLVEQLFHSAPAGSAFLTHSTADALRAEADSAYGWFIFDVATWAPLGVALYGIKYAVRALMLPVRGVKRVIQISKNQRNLSLVKKLLKDHDAFKKLNIHPGDWKDLDRVYEEFQTTGRLNGLKPSRTGVSQADLEADIRRAYLLLKSRVHLYTPDELRFLMLFDLRQRNPKALDALLEARAS